MLKGTQVLPRARQLLSRQHPACPSQQAVEEAVGGHALALLQRGALAASVVGDRGVGRKEVRRRLATQEHAAVLRVDADADSTVYPPTAPDGLLRADALAAPPWPGTGTAGSTGACAAACARCGRPSASAAPGARTTGRRPSIVTVVAAVPLQGPPESRVLAPTRAVGTAAQTPAMVRLDAQRGASETGFETMHAGGQDRFMVRSWVAMDRLLGALAVAYARVVLTLHSRLLRRFRAQAVAVLTVLSVVGDQVTAGNLAEAIGPDVARHARAWLSAWLT